MSDVYNEAPHGKTAGFLGGIPVATDPPLPILRISGPFIAARRQGFLAEADKTYLKIAEDRQRGQSGGFNRFNFNHWINFRALSF
ncbi:MAG: hypothetical protein HYT77_02510 [Deltaproteobacteria bacterium]|nr:hypothetical protein [Deltaproteobacteria bacterium]